MTSISNFRRERLDLAMADIGIREAEYHTCPNPDWILISFKHPDVKEGYTMIGESFFDFRKAYTQALRNRGFTMEVDNQGANPIGMSVRDFLPNEEYLIDGEILGLDRDGSLLQWNGDESCIYNCGETPEEYGLEAISADEMARIKPDMDARDYLAQALKAVA